LIVWQKYQWLCGALLAGLLFTLAFPLAGVAGFAWVVPGLALYAGVQQTARRAFQSGYLFGLVFCLGTLYWLNYMPVKGLPILAWVALAGYLALYYALWLWFCRRTLTGALGECLDAPWARRTWWILSCAAAWTLGEYLMGRLLTGFPFIAIGVTQHRMTPLVQLASVTGVPGLSFVVVWFSISLMFAMLALATRPRERWLAWREICLPLLAVAGLFAWGSLRVGRYARAVESGDRSLKVALVQPSFPQTLIWNAGQSTNRLNRMIELSREALRAGPDLLIWPEAGMPGLLRYDERLHRVVTGLAREHRVWLICGGDDARLPEDRPDTERPDFFNSVFLVSPEGKIAGQYDKRRLVIFGEYVPLSRWLPFLKKLTPIGEGFAAGSDAAQFRLGPLNLGVSPLICFEDIFADLARESAEPDTDLMVNLTNDGWFSESAQQWQHLANALFRAVETGRPLIRCANNGISCWIDAVGRARAEQFPDGRSPYARGVKVFEMPLAGSPLDTPYRRHGDWFVLLCGLLVVRACYRAWRDGKPGGSETD